MSYITHDGFLLVVVAGWTGKEREITGASCAKSMGRRGRTRGLTGAIRNAFPRREGAERREIYLKPPGVAVAVRHAAAEFAGRAVAPGWGNKGYGWFGYDWWRRNVRVGYVIE